MLLFLRTMVRLRRAREGQRSSFDAGGNATGVVDLDPGARCTSICADMVAIGVVAASDSVEVCLPTR